MNTDNKTPKPLLFKKHTLSNKLTKSPFKTLSIDEKEKLIKEKLIATVTKFNKTSTRNSLKREQSDKVNHDIKYPTIKVNHIT